jgi:hypothetical protein
MKPTGKTRVNDRSFGARIAAVVLAVLLTAGMLPSFALATNPENAGGGGGLVKIKVKPRADPKKVEKTPRAPPDN